MTREGRKDSLLALSLPYELRRLAAFKADVLTALGRGFIDVVFASYRRRARRRGIADGQCGAIYGQYPPQVNVCRPPGEWQTYDIIFRAPRFDDAGKVTAKARATVFQNGILVQNNEEFNGPTGIQYSQYKDEVKTGPLILQGDHDPVQFRNVWIVPQ